MILTDFIETIKNLTHIDALTVIGYPIKLYSFFFLPRW